jgi:uncharacterized protein YunC (DUF1805 family)
MIINSPLLLNSITDANSTSQGRAVVCGSHGGNYPAYLASAAKVSSIIFNDAGFGLENAGIAGVMALSVVGIPAASAAHDSCIIADANDMMTSGVISAVNALAQHYGVKTGDPVKTAIGKIMQCTETAKLLEPVNEARRSFKIKGNNRSILLVDSASLIRQQDEGETIITGSHGGLIGRDPARALKTKARLAVFNDAGIGRKDAGISRLLALDNKGVAAATVAHNSARIGDAKSTFETGVVSAVNRAAARLGLSIGDKLAEILTRL